MQHARDRRRAHAWPRRSSTSWPRATPAPTRSARSASSSAPRSARRRSTSTRSTGRSWCPASARRAARPTTCAGSSAPALPAVVPSVSREVLRHGPDLAALRAARSVADRAIRVPAQVTPQFATSTDRGAEIPPRIRARLRSTLYVHAGCGPSMQLNRNSTLSPQGRNLVTATVTDAVTYRRASDIIDTGYAVVKLDRYRHRPPPDRARHREPLLRAPARGQDRARQHRPQLRLPAVRHRVLGHARTVRT